MKPRNRLLWEKGMYEDKKEKEKNKIKKSCAVKVLSVAAAYTTTLLIYEVDSSRRHAEVSELVIGEHSAARADGKRKAGLLRVLRTGLVLCRGVIDEKEWCCEVMIAQWYVQYVAQYSTVLQRSIVLLRRR